jgi:hypothetical protein
MTAPIPLTPVHLLVLINDELAFLERLLDCAEVRAHACDFAIQRYADCLCHSDCPDRPQPGVPELKPGQRHPY